MIIKLVNGKLIKVIKTEENINGTKHKRRSNGEL